MIINKKYLAEYSPLPTNYDFSEVMNYVPVAQEIWLRPLVGDDLMDELEEQVKNNNLSEANSTLLTEGKLWQYLSYATCLEGLPFIWTNMSQVGITLGKSDNSDSVTLKDITYIEQHLRRQVEFLKDSVKRWCCEHYASFPLLDVCGCNCDCCCKTNPKLNHPNPNFQLFKPYRKKVDLK